MCCVNSGEVCYFGSFRCGNPALFRTDLPDYVVRVLSYCLCFDVLHLILSGFTHCTKPQNYYLDLASFLVLTHEVANQGLGVSVPGQSTQWWFIQPSLINQVLA